LLIAVAVAAFSVASAQTVTYTTQTSNFNTLVTETNNIPPYAGTYNNGVPKLANYASGGSSSAPGQAASREGDEGTPVTQILGDRPRLANTPCLKRVRYKRNAVRRGANHHQTRPFAWGGVPAALRPVGLNTSSSVGGRPRPYGRSAYTAAVQAQRREAWDDPPPDAAFSTGSPPA
jgi:hypothetical protein